MTRQHPDTGSYEPNVVVLFRQTHRPVHYAPDHVWVIRERLNRPSLPERVGAWIEEHAPAAVLGFLAGITVIAVPALWVLR